MVFVHRGRAAKVQHAAPYPPLLALAPWLPAAAATLALGDVAGLAGRDLLVAPLAFVLFGLLQAGRSLVARERQIAELTAPRELDRLEAR